MQEILNAGNTQKDFHILSSKYIKKDQEVGTKRISQLIVNYLDKTFKIFQSNSDMKLSLITTESDLRQNLTLGRDKKMAFNGIFLLFSISSIESSNREVDIYIIQKKSEEYYDIEQDETLSIITKNNIQAVKLFFPLPLELLEKKIDIKQKKELIRNIKERDKKESILKKRMTINKEKPNGISQKVYNRSLLNINIHMSRINDIKVTMRKIDLILKELDQSRHTDLNFISDIVKKLDYHKKYMEKEIKTLDNDIGILIISESKPSLNISELFDKASYVIIDGGDLIYKVDIIIQDINDRNKISNEENLSDSEDYNGDFQYLALNTPIQSFTTIKKELMKNLKDKSTLKKREKIEKPKKINKKLYNKYLSNINIHISRIDNIRIIINKIDSKLKELDHFRDTDLDSISYEEIISRFHIIEKLEYDKIYIEKEIKILNNDIWKIRILIHSMSNPSLDIQELLYQANNVIKEGKDLFSKFDIFIQDINYINKRNNQENLSDLKDSDGDLQDPSLNIQSTTRIKTESSHVMGSEENGDYIKVLTTIES